jgi:alanyl-tRNA synthetase
VVDAVERDDGAVVHVLSGSLDADEVEGRIDWLRRFDLMQQHTGQHIISAAAVEVLGANTVGFHLSDEYSTIDLDRAPLSEADLVAVEDLSNRVVFENRPVTARFVPDEEVAGLTLRKPLSHAGPVRVVSVPDFDRSACGGTHVTGTGEVGLIKLVRSERRGAETRLEFLCGGRALADYRAKNAMVLGLSQEFTVGHWELADMVHRLADEAKETRRELRRTRDALLDSEAEGLWHRGTPIAGMRVVKAALPGRQAGDLKHLAQRLAAHPGAVVMLATTPAEGEKCYFTFARNQDVDADMGALVRLACESVGGRGGGRPGFAQGGGPAGADVAVALEAGYQALVSAVSA